MSGTNGFVNVIWAESWDHERDMVGRGAYDGGRARTREGVLALMTACIDHHRAAGHPGRAYLTDDDGHRLTLPRPAFATRREL